MSATAGYATILPSIGDGVAPPALNRRERLNAISGEMHAEIAGALDRIEAGAGANIALLRSGRRHRERAVRAAVRRDRPGSRCRRRPASAASRRPGARAGVALTAAPIGAEQAAAWGLIGRAVTDDGFAQEIELLIAQLAVAPTAGLVALKHAIRSAWTRDFDAQLDRERGLSGDMPRASPPSSPSARRDSSAAEQE